MQNSMIKLGRHAKCQGESKQSDLKIEITARRDQQKGDKDNSKQKRRERTKNIPFIQQDSLFSPRTKFLTLPYLQTSLCFLTLFCTAFDLYLFQQEAVNPKSTHLGRPSPVLLPSHLLVISQQVISLSSSPPPPHFHPAFTQTGSQPAPITVLPSKV